MEITNSSRPIRILQIISGFAIEGPLGGIERFGIELVKALDKTEVESIVCGMWAYDTPYEYAWRDHLRKHGIEAYIAADWDETSPYNSFMQAYRGMRNAAQTVDIIHSHCQFGDVAALLLRRRYAAQKLVRTVHNEREWMKRPLRRKLLTNTLYPVRFDVEIGVAQQVVDNLNARPRAKRLHKQGVLLHNSLNTKRFANIQVDKKAKLAELGIPPDAIVVGSIGRLAPQKGYDVLVNSAEILISHTPNLYILIIGDGELANQLKQQAANSPFSSHIIFTGARNDIEELLSCFDVFVNSSLWEGLPTVILESMAAGIPIVATRVGGNMELIKEGVTGFLTEAGDPIKLAHKINELLCTESQHLTKIITTAKQFVLQNFSINHVADKHIMLYKQLISSN